MHAHRTPTLPTIRCRFDGRSILETTGIFLSLATITVACLLLLGDVLAVIVWPGVAWVVGEMVG